jgi:hypothetical protein
VGWLWPAGLATIKQRATTIIDSPADWRKSGLLNSGFDPDRDNNALLEVKFR